MGNPGIYPHPPHSLMGFAKLHLNWIGYGKFRGFRA